MKLFKLLCLTALSIILLAGCKSTGQKALQKGDYYTACKQAIEKLRSSPDNKKSIEALNQAYPQAVSYTDKEVARLMASPSNDSRYYNIYRLYESMNSIAVEISRSPAALKVIPNPSYYSSQLEAARNKAAEELYSKAERLMNSNSRALYKEAYYAYLEVNNLISGYQDVQRKIETSLTMATLKVVLEQVPVTGSYKISGDFFHTNVFDYFSNNIRNEFIRVYSPEEAEKARIKPDQIIRLQFADFIVGQTREKKEVRDVSRDSVIIGTQKDRGRDINIYGTVKAKLTLRNIEVSSSGVLNAVIMEYGTNRTLKQQNFPGTYVWSDWWGSYNGDERALTRKELDMCNRDASMPPPPQDMFVQFTVPIFKNLTGFIQNFYRNY